MNERQQTTWKGAGLAMLLLALFLALVVAPLGVLIGSTLPQGMSGLATLRGLLQAPDLQQILLHTLAVAVLASGVASLVAIPAAWVAARSGRITRTLISALGFLPLTMPPFVTAAMLERFGTAFNATAFASRFGEIHVRGNSTALVLVFALHFLPLILFSLMAGLERMDRAFAESARSMGAGGLTVWRRVTLPLATPAYAAGAGLVLLRILEDLGTPLYLGVDQMLAPQLLLDLNNAGHSDPSPNIAALLLFGVSLLTTALAWSALLPSFDPPGVTPRHPARWRAGPGRRIGTVSLVLGLGVLSLAPVGWLLVVALGTSWSGGLLPVAYSPAHFLAFSTESFPTLGSTLVYAAGAGILSLLIGGAFGSLTTRPGSVARLLRFAATGMLAIPGVVLALAYVRTQDLAGIGPPGWTGFGWLALALVVAFKQLPFAQRLVAHTLRTLRPGELESARNLGATAPEAWMRIALPALGCMIAGVFLLGFVAAAMELSAVLLLIEGPQTPFALSLFRNLQTPATIGLGAAQGVALAGFAAAGLLSAHALLRKRRKRATPATASHGYDTKEAL